MISVNFEALNPLEQKIHATLLEHRESEKAFRISQAAELCGCSTSKISKFVKKIGFVNFKQYLDFLYGKPIDAPERTSELERLQRFINGFDTSLVDDIARLIDGSDKVLLLGVGPSFLCAQYFEYKLKTCTNKIAIATPDDLLATSMIDSNALLLIFTVTGKFRSFETLYHEARSKGGRAALVIEEFNPALILKYDKVFCLTNECQPDDLMPYEKSRTVFFIFMEEVIQKLIKMQNDKNDS